MKRILLGVVIVSALSLSAGAQKFSIGPSAGVGSTWISNYEDRQHKTHGNVGVSLIYSTKSSFGFGADVKYSFEGGERKFNQTVSGSTFTTEQEVALNYVRIPLKAMFFFGNYGQRVRPKVALGPSFGFLVGGKTTVENTSLNGTFIGKSETDSKDAWDNFDIGIHGSAGINYRLVKNTWLTADVVYYHGIIDQLKNNTSTTDYANRNLGLNIGVNFGL